MDGWGGERQIGKTLKEIEPKHIERYKFALEYILNDYKILDAATGIGYGAFILSMGAKDVIGVDKSEEAIKYAKTYWSDVLNIEYRVFDLTESSFEDLGMFNCIVSIETIEHLQVPIDETLKKFDEILTKYGFLIISHPEDQKPGAKFHHHNNIKGENVTEILEGMGYYITDEWLQPGYFEYFYHLFVAEKCV
ncbi:unnamed protein product [marine sediment metagenome]|uniref:Methyltransferase domain-containing protein n=1 Tax=marine sediment metagenome TaxID=412755 RepID=X1GT69_9ZZZZ